MVWEFISTVYHLTSANRWKDLKEYFALIRELLTLPRLDITVYKPNDKEA